MRQNKETLKKHFETGDKPTQEQYSDLIDSYIDSKQPEGEANRRFVIDETGEVNIVGSLAKLVSARVDENGIVFFIRDDKSSFSVDLSDLKNKNNSSGLERITEEGNSGWRLAGTDPVKYGNIGIDAIDFSQPFYGGNDNTIYGATGRNSCSIGSENIASGELSFSVGYLNSATGLGAVTIGQQVKATGSNSTSIGASNISSGETSFTTGSMNKAIGQFSSAEGNGNTAESFAEKVVGVNSTLYQVNSSTSWNALDRAFNVGIGAPPIKADGLTVLKNGTVIAPSVTNSLINIAGKKALISKEYADYVYKYRIINSSVPQTSVMLNISHPIESSPIGTRIINVDSVERYVYTRITNTLWRRGELLTDI